MSETAAAADIARTIQLAVVPVYLLAGIGGIMQVISNRLNRVIDRSRVLERLQPESSGAEHDRHVWELLERERRGGGRFGF